MITSLNNILRPKQAAAYLGGISLVTLWRLSQRPEFPRKVKLTGKAVGYKKCELDAWIAGRQEG